MATKESKKKKSGADDTSGKKVYYDVKRRVLGWEKNNYDKLAVLKTGNGFCKMFGHSAIIYVCQIAKRLDVKAELVSDTDFELVSDEPVCLFKDLDQFEKRLATLKIYRSSIDDGVVVYDLGYKVDAADLVMMQRENEIMRERANKLVLPSEIFPGYRNDLRLLTCNIYEVTRKMNPTARTLVGDSMLGVCAHLSENFVEAANGHTDMHQYMKNAVKDLRRMNAKLLLAMDVRLVDEKKIFLVIQQTNKVLKRAASALTKLESRDDKKDY